MSDVGDGATISTERGQAALIGFVILIGMVAVASAGILVVGGDLLTTTEHQTEEERVELSFVKMSQSLSETSFNSDTANTINLDAGEDGAIARDETGYMRVESDGLKQDLNLTFGTIEYESDSGTKIAYESGAVFRETGEETRVVSSPPIYYDFHSETLTLPVITVSGDEQLGTGDISMSHNETTAYAETNVVEDESVDLIIKSEYWRGWATYFEQQASNAVVRNIEPAEGDSAILTVTLGHLEMEDAFEEGVTYSESWSEQGSGSDSVEEEIELNPGSFGDLNNTIHEMIEDAENNEFGEEGDDIEEQGVIDGSEQIENGTHLAGEVSLNDELVVNLSDGNATILVDGDVDLNDEGLSVRDWENENSPNNSLKIYTTGNFEMSGGDVKPEEIDGERQAEQLQLFGTPDTSVGITGGTYVGTIFTPTDYFEGENKVIDNKHCSGHQVCLLSNPKFTGSIIAHSVHFQANAQDIEYDDSLQDANLTAYPDGYVPPPQLTYVNVAHYDVKVTNK
ncbi:MULTISPECIES: DUF7289 family protein [Natrialbaceae]|uniref:DUF7289 family protein n=1 Tax=Natrialbaceae TaxID=1644061 RepID=UPI00207C1DF7|nr:hypothetical protein [Natronococcus sp. CG52]